MASTLPLTPAFSCDNSAFEKQSIRRVLSFSPRLLDTQHEDLANVTRDCTCGECTEAFQTSGTLVAGILQPKHQPQQRINVTIVSQPNLKQSSRYCVVAQEEAR